MNEWFVQNSAAFTITWEVLQLRQKIKSLYYVTQLGCLSADLKLFSKMSHLEGLIRVIISSEKQFQK